MDGETLRPFNLKLSNTTEFRPKNQAKTGLNGEFGQVNMAAPQIWQHVEYVFTAFTFAFVDTESGEPVSLGHFKFSFFDFDNSWNPASECVTTRGFSETQIALHGSQLVDTVDFLDSSYQGFCSTQWGGNADNPTSPDTLTELQIQRSVQYVFEGVTEIEVRFFVTCCNDFGRNFFFAGETNIRPDCLSPLPPPPQPPSPPTPPFPPSPPALQLPSPPVSPDLCTLPERLADRLRVQLHADLAGNKLVLGAAPPAADGGRADSYRSSGVQHACNLTGLYRHEPLSVGSVGLFVQGQQYLVQSQLVPTEYPSVISAVLRTPAAWIDRVQVRVAFQVRDGWGNVKVGRPTAVVMRIAREAQSAAFGCDTSGTQRAGRRYLGSCSCTSLDAAWFSPSGVRSAAVSVALRDSANSADVSSVSLPSLTLHVQPSWWEAALRTATVGNGLAAPFGAGVGGGVFVTLPASPLHTGEEFSVFMYAHTAGLSLNTWRVRLYFESSLLDYRSFGQSSHFNSATPSASSGEVSWLATGVKSTVTDAQVTGSAIYLLAIRMRVHDGVTPGTYRGGELGLSPRATELISGAAFVQNVDGQVFDGRDTFQALGEVVVVESSPVGVFAYPPSGTLVNLAPLHGFSSSYSLVVVEVGSDDRYTEETREASGATCTSSVASSVLELRGCSVEMGVAQTVSKAGVSVLAQHADGFSATATFDVFTPQTVSLAVDDGVLNHFQGASGEAISGCSSSGRAMQPYQRTRIRAYADGLDATLLVRFSTEDPSVAGVSSARNDVIEGRGVGETTAFLAGPAELPPDASIVVSDTLVFALELVVRVITGASWTADGRPPSQYAFGEMAVAAAAVSSVMSAEGDSGRMFSRVVWSDGQEEDVGYSPESAVEEMRVRSSSISVALTAPSGGENFWQVGVAVGAVRECVSSVVVNWTVCDIAVVSGQLPLHLDLPDPLGAHVRVRESRLTPVGDDASVAPISVLSASALLLMVDFADGSQRTMSADERASYSATDPTCAVADDEADTVMVISTAVCTAVTVVATVRLGVFVFVISDTRPVVYLDYMTLSFSGYPDTTQ